MLNRLEELKAIRREKAQILEKENELLRPVCKDLNQLPVIYQWFCDIRQQQGCPPRQESVNERKKFIFIALYLYSPATLSGDKMLKGLREKLAQVLAIHCPSSISTQCADLVFLYQHYKNFQQDIEHIYQEIVQKIEESARIENNTDQI